MHWPTGIDYKLQGKIASWTMTGENGVIRKMTFDTDGQLVEDTFRKRASEPYEWSPYRHKAEYEKIAENKPSSSVETDNEETRDQALVAGFYNPELPAPTFHVTQVLDERGNILIHKSTTHVSKRYHWNSIHHENPYYDYIDSTGTVTLFRYNESDSLIEFLHYHSDPFKNKRVVFKRDSLSRLVERLEYGNLSISVQYMPDNYMTEVLGKVTDNQFDINTIYPEYWNSSISVKPNRQTWRYDDAGNKVEYICYCYKPDGYNAVPSYQALWEYNLKGIPIKETHYSQYTRSGDDRKVRGIMQFDELANIVEERVFYGETEYLFTYQITYY